MGIYIKGQTKPENCNMCIFRHTTYMLGRHVCLARGMSEIEVDINSGVDARCPLIEVSEPHGRLIDASYKVDMPFYDDEYEEYSVRTVTVEKLLMMADNGVPTVIEAEGSEDE